MSSSPTYFGTPGLPTLSQLTAANTNLDGTGTLVQLLAGVAAGRRIARVRVATAVATDPVANKITFFVSIDNDVSRKFLCDVTIADLATPAAAVRSGYVEVPELVGLVLVGTANILKGGTWASQATNVLIEYDDA